MVAVGVNLHLELFAELYQLFGIFGPVLEVYIVVCHAVYQQQVAVKLVGTGKGGTGLIACLLYTSHPSCHGPQRALSV